MAIPIVLRTDVSEVAEALTAAAAAWPHDVASAVTWVRRAAQIAGQAGDDERALALALSATELADRLVSSDVMPVARKHDESAVTSEVDVSTFRKTS